MDSEYLSITEVAELLNVTRQAVHLSYQKGKFPNSKKIGKLIVIPKTDLEAIKNDIQEDS
jgi:excisionase family DNA binding protein